MAIEVLRVGQRVVRDDRVTTHVALVARAFGAKRILMEEVNPEIKDTISSINQTWGGDFKVDIIKNWRKIIRERKGHTSIIHLTMYGEDLDSVVDRVRGGNILVVVGAGKMPREVYDLADYNIAVGNQPHSEVSALAVLLDRLQEGRELSREYAGARRRIIPSSRGKMVVSDEK